MCKNKYTVPAKIEVDVSATSFDEAEDIVATLLEESITTNNITINVDADNISKHICL